MLALSVTAVNHDGVNLHCQQLAQCAEHSTQLCCLSKAEFGCQFLMSRPLQDLKPSNPRLSDCDCAGCLSALVAPQACRRGHVVSHNLQAQAAAGGPPNPAAGHSAATPPPVAWYVRTRCLHATAKEATSMLPASVVYDQLVTCIIGKTFDVHRRQLPAGHAGG